jgi:hypothetical protein
MTICPASMETARAVVEAIVEVLVRGHGYQRIDKPKPSPQGGIRQNADGLYEGGPADWGRYLDNLISHDDTPCAMALLRTGMSDGAAVTLCARRLAA